MVGHLSVLRSTSFDPRYGVKRYRIPSKNNRNGKTSTDKRQSQQIASLQRQLAGMRTAPSKKKRDRPVRKRNGVGVKSVADDPVLTSVKAILRPFDTLKGIAAPLSDGRPAQKFMAKAQTQITIAAGQIMAFMFTPCIASDRASLAICVGAASLGSFTSAATWYSAVNAGAYNLVSTSTPYSGGVLTASGIEFSSVGAGLKFTYEGTELNRGGTFRYIYDRAGAYNNDDVDWLSQGPQSLVTFINSQANTIRQSINMNNVVEINSSLEEVQYLEAISSEKVWVGADNDPSGNSIGVSPSVTTPFSLRPVMVGYFLNSSTGTVSFHVDVIEHWAIAGPTIQALQTDSYTHAPMAAHVSGVLASVRQAHASNPNVHHATVASTTVKALKSPMGHELLNVGLKMALA